MSLYSQSKPPLNHSYTRPNASTTKNNTITSCPFKSIRLDAVAHGNKNVISKSNTKKRIAIKKNLIEKGSPGAWKGSNPHSYTETFSLSGDFSPKKKEAKDITIDNNKLTKNAIKTKKYSKFMSYFYDVGPLKIVFS